AGGREPRRRLRAPGRAPVRARDRAREVQRQRAREAQARARRAGRPLILPSLSEHRMTRTLLVAAFAAAALGAAPTVALAQKVELDTTAGKIVLQLDAKAAPATVENFVKYVQAGHYDGTQFHRVIDGFMIQAGGYTEDFSQKPTRPPVRNEAESASKAGLTNTPGTIAM